MPADPCSQSRAFLQSHLRGEGINNNRELLQPAMSPDGRTTMSHSRTGSQTSGTQQLTVIHAPVCLFYKGNGAHRRRKDSQPNWDLILKTGFFGGLCKHTQTWTKFHKRKYLSTAGIFDFFLPKSCLSLYETMVNSNGS